MTDKTDEILKKILDSSVTEEDMNKEKLVNDHKQNLITQRRHAIGMRSALDNQIDLIEKQLKFFTPKCPVCYEKYKFILKCICKK